MRTIVCSGTRKENATPAGWRNTFVGRRTVDGSEERWEEREETTDGRARISGWYMEGFEAVDLFVGIDQFMSCHGVVS